MPLRATMRQQWTGGKMSSLTLLYGPPLIWLILKWFAGVCVSVHAWCVIVCVYMPPHTWCISNLFECACAWARKWFASVCVCVCVFFQVCACSCLHSHGGNELQDSLCACVRICFCILLHPNGGYNKKKSKIVYLSVHVCIPVLCFVFPSFFLKTLCALTSALFSGILTRIHTHTHTHTLMSCTATMTRNADWNSSSTC